MEPSAVHTPSIIQIRSLVAVFLSMLVAVYLGFQLGESEVKVVFGILMVFLLSVLMLRMGEKAWMLMPMGMTLSIPVPVSVGRDFSSKEMVTLLLLAHTILRSLLKRERITLFRRQYLWAYLYVGWAFLVFSQNPTGLMIFGSEAVGARFYFQIFLGLCGLILMANISVEEKDVKWILGTILGSSLINMIYMTLNYEDVRGDVLTMTEIDEHYTWHQALSGPAIILFMILFAKLPLPRLVSLRGVKWWPLFGIAFGLILASGKRAALASCMAFPLFAAILRRQFGLGMIMVAFFLTGITFLTIGHNRWFQLPMSAQRALSILPGDWGPMGTKGLEDNFREILREDAMKRIEDDPIIGKGCGIQVSDWFADLNSSQGKIISGIRAGGSWHNTWLGTMADFGIPAGIFWAGLWISLTFLAWRLYARFLEGSHHQVLTGYIFIVLCWQWMNSWTSGDSAGNVLGWFWLYGLLYALHAQSKKAPVQQ